MNTNSDEQTASAQASQTHGTPEETSLTVKRLGGEWVVENGLGESVGSAPDREGAERKARELVDTQKASGFSVVDDHGAAEAVDS